MYSACAWREYLLDVAAVRHHADFVAGSTDNLRKHNRRRGRLIKLRHAHPMRAIALHDGFAYKLRLSAAKLKCRPREPPRVEHNPDLLRALRRELPRDQLAAPRGRSP